MQSKALIVLSLAILLVLALAVGYWWSAPRLMHGFSPDGVSDVLSGTTLRLTFSRLMQSDSVVESSGD